METWKFLKDFSFRNQLTGDFPPNSRVTFFKFDSEEAFRMALPVVVEPVKANLSTSM